MTSEFDAAEFRTCYPVPWLMREHRQDWWFRIHSLPESKRYPTTTAEWAILMQRHNELADAVLVPDSSCRLLYSQLAVAPFPSEKLPGIGWKPFRSVGEGEDRVDSWTASVVWRYDTFSDIIRMKADDQIAYVAFHSLRTDALYCPYDGGADVFSLNRRLLNTLRSRFSAWRSSHPLGL